MKGIAFFARLWILTALLAAAAPAAGQTPPAPPAPPADNHAQSLPSGEVESLLAGEGMGLAHIAELNHYPGPRHVLAFEKELGLSAEQHAAFRQLFGETIDQARKVGRQLVDAEAELSEAFARGTVTEDTLRSLVAKAAELRGQLRVVHLAAHLKARKLLTAEQVAKYDKLRGNS